MGVLESILAAKRATLLELARLTLPAAPPSRSFSLKRASGEPLRLITEIKRRAPSTGPLSVRLSVADRARSYARAGSSMVSVLTDTPFFDGAYQHLREVRAACELPILCKDFVIDELQLDVARAFGADAVLLIARCLGESELARLYRAAASRELIPFVEIATEEEASWALAVGAQLIGVNARDLDTLVMDPARAARVLSLVPSQVVRVHLSGLGSAESVEAIARSGVDAALVGEALMRADDPEPLLRAMLEHAADLSKLRPAVR